MARTPTGLDEPLPNGLWLPPGPPLHLEQAGQATAHLESFMLPKRMERLREVLTTRTRHVTALLEGIHDPHNIAACLRSCEAVGVQDLHVIPWEGKAQKLSRGVGAGTAAWLTLHTHDDTQSALKALREAGYLIAATTLNPIGDRALLDNLRADKRLCLVFGNEHTGVSPLVLEEADLQVQIPMLGFVESLNVSVAFAVAMYHLRRELNARPSEEWALSGAERTALLDRWVVSDVGRSKAILVELARRLA